MAIACLMVAGGAATSHAADILVTTTADATAPDGACSLREAMVNANNNASTHADCVAGAGNDVIRFAVGGTITLSAPLPPVVFGSTLTIDGSGHAVIISGNRQVQPFRFDVVTTVTLIRLTITQGFSTLRGGAIRNDGTLIIRNSTLADNEVRVGAGSVASGGAIYSEGSLTLIESTITGNRAIGVGADANGGGIRSSEPGVVSITSSTISHNIARTTGITARGGGISLFGEGPHSIVNSTISSNAVEAETAPANTDGGGIATSGALFESSVRLTVTNSTIAGNRTDGSPFPSAAGIMGTGEVVLRNNLIAGNLAAAAPSDCGGQFVADAPNLIHDGNCSVTGTAPISAVPLLGPLGNYGGPTATHALLAGSPGIGAAAPAFCTAAPLNGRDQRDAPRTGSCDLGAFERSAGGWGLRVSSSAGAARLDWSDGEIETGYIVLRYNLSTGAQTLLPGGSAQLGPTATTITDTPAAGQISCYIVLAMTGSTIAGTSDFLCAMPGLQSGPSIPSTFTLALSPSSRATLTWVPPAGAAGHAMYLAPLDGSAASFVGVPNSGFAELTLGGPSCAILFAFDNAGAFSYTNMLCGFPTR